MARLEIPEKLLPAYIEFLEVGLSVLALADYELSEEEAGLYDLLMQFVENHSGPKPCPYCQCTEIKLEKSNEYFITQECTGCGAGGPNIAGDDENESNLLRWNQRDDNGICPWCDFMYDPHCDGSDGEFYAWCPKCEATGPMADTPKKAEELWKRQDS